MRGILLLALAAGLFGPAPAGATQDTDTTEFGRLQVIGSAARVQSIAGSAHYIGPDELARFDHLDVNRVLRQVPGVYLVEEEGFGLRPSIGMRGSGTDRSARITLLEDGVLVAPAPYAAPAAYHFPTTARMHAVEVRKGSSSIKHGPYTTGGAINLLSTPIPDRTAASARAYTGSNGTHHLHGWAGGGSGRFGWLIETVQQRSDGFKELDGGGSTGYGLQDYVVKLGWRPEGALDQYFELKFGAVEHDGDETYLGLTAEDFAATPYRRYAASQLDHIDTRHRQYQLRHRASAGALEFTTVAYRNDFSRAWYKLHTVGGRSLSAVLADPAAYGDELSWLRGASSPDDAFVVRDNNRTYYAQGLQHVIGWSTQTGAVAHDLELGVRLHRDEEDRHQFDDRFRMRDGRLESTTAGAPGSQENRVGQAKVAAVHLQDEIAFGPWVLTPGLRHERIETTRTDFALGDAARADGPIQVREASHTVTIPGLGASYAAGTGATLFGSVHKGFTPPAPGARARAEESVNYEFGFRYGDRRFSGEMIGFVNDYSNLVGTCTASTGGGCTIGEQFDGGRVAMHGIEALARYSARVSERLRMPLRFSYTFTDAEFRTSFSSAFGEFGDVQRGDALPYLPRHQWQVGAGLEADRWQASLTASWVDAMRTAAGTGRPDRTERTDSYLVVDLAASVELRPGVELFGKVLNVFDDAHIVAWRPAGARPGMPRSLQAGLRLAL